MKKLLTFAFAVAALACANASELWWTVNTETTSDFDWATAKLFASADGNNFEGTQLGDEWTKAEIADWGNAFTDLTGSENAFYIELYNSEGNRVATSATRVDDVRGYGAVSAAALAGSVWDGGMSTPSPYTFSQFSANVVPEPTSGLMILLGLAALGLKRKHA